MEGLEEMGEIERVEGMEDLEDLEELEGMVGMVGMSLLLGALVSFGGAPVLACIPILTAVFTNQIAA